MRAALHAQVLSKDHAPLLYSLLFGEGVVNDATAIVLLGASQARHLPRAGPTRCVATPPGPSPACTPNGHSRCAWCCWLAACCSCSAPMMHNDAGADMRWAHAHVLVCRS